MDFTKDAVLIQELGEEKNFANLMASNGGNTSAALEVIIDYLNKTNTSQMSGNETDGYVPYSDRPETYIVPVLFAIIFIIGVLGNGTLIRIFIEHRNMRNVPNMYLPFYYLLFSSFLCANVFNSDVGGANAFLWLYFAKLF